MNKANIISIFKQAFYLDDDAYKILSKYLSDLKKLFADTEAGEEIVEDIEIRVAEKLREKAPDVKAVISKREVEAVIEEIGGINTLRADSDEVEGKSTEATTKQLYRDTDNAVLGGVASGVANYFNVDPLLVRIGFIIAGLFGFAGVFAYLVLWVIMPPADTAYKRVSMMGKKVNKQNLENAVASAKVSAEKGVSGLRQGASKSGSGLLKVLGVIARVFLGIIGLGFLIAAVAAAVGVTIVSGVVIFQNKFIPQNVWDDIGRTTFDYVGIGATWLTVILILIPLAVIGAGMIRQKGIKLNSKLLYSLVGALIISASIGSIWIADYAPRAYSAVDDYAHTVTTKDLAEFSRIEFTGERFDDFYESDVFDVEVIYDSSTENRLEVTGWPEHVEEAIIKTTEVDGGTLKLDGYSSGHEGIAYIDHIKIYTNQPIQRITNDFIGLRALLTNVEGDNIELVDNAWNSHFRLQGSVNDLVVKLSEDSKLEAENLVVQTANIYLSSESEAFVKVDRSLTAKRPASARLINYGSGESDIESVGESDPGYSRDHHESNHNDERSYEIFNLEY